MEGGGSGNHPTTTSLMPDKDKRLHLKDKIIHLTKFMNMAPQTSLIIILDYNLKEINHVTQYAVIYTIKNIKTMTVYAC